MLSPFFPVWCAGDRMLGSGNLGSGYLGVLTISGNFCFSTNQTSNLNSLDEIILQSTAFREVTFKRNQLLQSGSRSDVC